MKAREEIGLSAIEQYGLLIRFFLKESPADDLEDFARQSAGALWIEERMLTGMARILGGK